MSPSLSQLPFELLSHIISFLARNGVEWQNTPEIYLYSREEKEAKHALLACSTACRSLRQATLPYLFHTVAMYIDPAVHIDSDGDKDHDELEEDLQEEQRCRSLSQLQKFIHNCPRICQAIRELRICTARADKRRYEHARSFLYIDTVRFVIILRRLPKLRTLALRDVHFTSLDVKQLPTLSKIPSLNQFSFYISHSLEFVEMLPILTLMNFFAEIKNVLFDGFSLRILPNSLDDTPSFPAGLRSLRLSNCWSIEMLLPAIHRDLSENSGQKSLESLELSYVHRKVLAGTRRLLSVVGPTLRDLTLCLIWLWDGDAMVGGEDLELLKLSHCPNLESFTLRWQVEAWPFEANITQLGIVLSFLDECPRIREVTLCISMDGDRKQLWECMRKISGPIEDHLTRLCTLKRVKIVLPPCAFRLHGEAFVGNFAKVNFPRLYRRGLL